MTSVEAVGRLSALGVPVVRTAEAAAALGTSASATTHLLNAMAAAGLGGRIRRGLWWVGPKPDPLMLPEYLTSPYPAYVSLQTALYFHGVLSQMADVIYAVTLDWPGRVETSVATYSLHRVAPEVFGGFTVTSSGVKLATVEKAFFDMAYLSAGRSRRFVALPEVELPAKFDDAQVRRWISALPRGGRMRAQVAGWFRRQPAFRRRAF